MTALRRVIQMRPAAKWLIVASSLVVAVLIVLLIAIDGGDRTKVAAEQFRSVELGDSKAEVSNALGDPGETGTHTGRDPSTSTEVEYPDCWFYSPTGPRAGTSDEVVVCFEAGEVILTSSPF
jgi:hypothetical protein